MAIGTVTIVSRVSLGEGSEELISVTFAGDGDYHTGGTPQADILAPIATALALVVTNATDKNVRGVCTPTIKDVIAGNCGVYAAYWDGVNKKLKVLSGGSATRAEAANHADLSGTTFALSLICV